MTLDNIRPVSPETQRQAIYAYFYKLLRDKEAEEKRDAETK